MFRLTKLADYGVVLLIEMANRPGEVFTPAKLADSAGIPKPTVSKLLKQMTLGGLLASQRGKNGGYRLKTNPEDLSVAQVLAVLEGPFALTSCSEGVGACHLETTCRARRNWQRINRVIYESLDQVSLAAMAKPLGRVSGDLQVFELERS